jgi:hypothetical protein
MLRVHGIKRIILLLCLLAVLASSEEAPKICAFSVRLSSPDQPGPHQHCAQLAYRQQISKNA